MTSVVGAAVAFVLTVAWRVLTFAGFQNDHYVHLARAQQVLLGDLPLRDFVDPGMPFMYLTSAAAWMLWGGSPGTELFLVAAGFALGAALTFAVVHRLTGSVPAAAAATVLEVLIAPRTYSYPKVLLYAAAAYALVALVASPSRRRAFLAGALTGVAFLFRHDHGVYIGIAIAAAIVAITAAHGRRFVAERLAAFCIGAALLAVPWLGYAAYHQGLPAYVSSGIAFSRAESARNRGGLSFPSFQLTQDALVRLRPPRRPTATVDWTEDTNPETRRRLEQQYGLEPVPNDDNRRRREYYGNNASPALMRALADDPHVEDVSGLDRFVEWTAFDAMLARVSPARIEIGRGWQVDANAHVWLLYVFHAVPLLCGFAAWRRWSMTGQRWAGESIAIASIALLALLVNVGLLRGSLVVWLPDAIAPAAILGGWLTATAWAARSGGSAARIARRCTVVVLLAATAGAIAVVGDWNSQLNRSGVRDGAGGVIARASDLQSRLWSGHRDTRLPPSGVSEALLPFFPYVDRCTAITDRLLMTRLYPDVFVLAGRGFAGGHVALLEGFYSSVEDQERMIAQLRRESVPLVLMLRDEEFRGDFELVSAYIDARYEPMTDIAVEEAALRVLVDKHRPRRTDPATGWPCFT
jgi:hypothetical protein